MPQQTTLWRFLKRDASSMETNDSPPPTPKKAKSSIALNKEQQHTPPTNPNGLFLPIYPLSSSIHASSRTLSSPSLSKMDCDDSQMILDCGQKRFGPEMCHVCGMVYSPINGEDVLVHERYHRQLAAPPRFNRRLVTTGIFICVQEFEDGYIFKCRFDEENVRMNKNGCQESIEEICSRMNEELGQEANSQRTGLFSPVGRNSNLGFDKCGRQLYVFVSRTADSALCGVLMVDHLKFAYRYNSDGCLDDQPRDVAMGVNRIWTWAGARRRRIGSRLVECARCNFYFGAPILKKHIAFSDPTISGLEFAKKYCGSDSLLIYRFG